MTGSSLPTTTQTEISRVRSNRYPQALGTGARRAPSATVSVQSPMPNLEIRHANAVVEAVERHPLPTPPGCVSCTAGPPNHQ